MDIPHNHVDEHLRIRRVMKIRLLEEYDPAFLPLERLKEHGVCAVRGPRRMPESLLYEIEGRAEDVTFTKCTCVLPIFHYFGNLSEGMY